MKRFLAAGLAIFALTAAPASAGSLLFFQTPDGNIGCALFKGGKHIHGQARCDIASHSWPTPPRPKSCPLDYGFGLEVGFKGRGHFVCAGDTALHQGPMLAVGSFAAKGRFTCTVFDNGVRCVNRRTQHGFELSAAEALHF